MKIKPTGVGCTFGLFTDDHGDGCEQILPGDEVFWTDPDATSSPGRSRHYVVQTIEVRGDCLSVVIRDVEGDVLECFASELS